MHVCVCVKERGGVVLQSFGGHNRQKETRGHRKMNTERTFRPLTDQEHVSSQPAHITATLHARVLQSQIVFTSEIMLHYLNTV